MQQAKRQWAGKAQHYQSSQPFSHKAQTREHDIENNELNM